MARIIFKWRYLKANASGKHSENLVKYIARREGVEKLDDSWKSLSATKAQRELIGQILVDYPDLAESFEYQDYEKMKTKGAASEFISRAIEDKIDLIGKRENYVGYIAMRPHVEKTGAHGLFTDSDVPINLSAVAKEVAEHKGVVFTEILSLRREDAIRLGYDRGKAWRDLLRGQTDAMAAAMKIPLTDLRWYAAFHNEGHHPHVHIVAYSTGKEPYMSEQGLHKLKSTFAREIFKQDLLQVYEKQTAHRNALTQESRDVLSEIVGQINDGVYENETVEMLLRELAEQLSRTKGKKVYGYLPQKAKNLVNGIVDELEKDSRISALYDLWYEQRHEVLKTYTDQMPERVPLSQNKEFRSVKNAVIQEALNILYDKVTFEDAMDEREDPAPDVYDEPIKRRDEPSERKNPWDDPDDMHYQYRKAKEYLDKESEKYDPIEAVRWLKLSAGQGYDIAMYRLGKMFLHGDGVDKDIGYALHWLWQADAKNNMYAQYLLGKLYLKGDEIYADFSKAEELFEKASRQGNSYAKYALAKMHLDGLAEHCNTKKALFLLRESADLGNQWAQVLFGKLLLKGELTDKDPTEAEKYLTAAAYKNNSQAMSLLGRLYLSDDGIPKDVTRGLYWLRRAVEEDENPYAMYQLGKMYLYGQEVERDYDMAVRLLSASAEQDNSYAKHLLENYHPHSNQASTSLAAMRLIGRLSQIFRENMKHDERTRQLTEKKLWLKIKDKKQAHGLKLE